MADETTDEKKISAKVRETLTEGETQLLAAQHVMNEIKKSIVSFQDECQSFTDKVTGFYDDAKGSRSTSLSIYEKAGMLARRVVSGDGDYKRSRLDELFGGLLHTAERINGRLGDVVGENQERLDKADETLDDLLDAMESSQSEIDEMKKMLREVTATYNTTVDRYNSMIDQADAKKADLQKAREAGKTEIIVQLTGEIDKIASSITGLYKDMNAAEREKDRVKEDVLAKAAELNQYQNQAEFLSTYRRNMSTIVSEGRKFHRQLTSETEALQPLFTTLQGAATVVEFQKKALDARQTVKNVANASLVAVAGLSKALTTRMGEVQHEKFIEGRTLKALKAIDEDQREEIIERDKKLMNAEHAFDTTGLFQRAEKDPEVIDLEQAPDGSFKAATKAKAKKEE